MAVTNPCPAPDCPIAGDVRQVVDLSGDLTCSLRTLRRDLRQCAGCPKGDGCALRTTFQDAVSAAITQIMEEWNLPTAANKGAV